MALAAICRPAPAGERRRREIPECPYPRCQISGPETLLRPNKKDRNTSRTCQPNSLGPIACAPRSSPPKPRHCPAVGGSMRTTTGIKPSQPRPHFLRPRTVRRTPCPAESAVPASRRLARGLGAVGGRAAPRPAGDRRRPPRSRFDADHQPAPGRSLARHDRRSHPRRRHSRPPGPQCASHCADRRFLAPPARRENPGPAARAMIAPVGPQEPPA